MFNGPLHDAGEHVAELPADFPAFAGVKEVGRHEAGKFAVVEADDGQRLAVGAFAGFALEQNDFMPERVLGRHWVRPVG